jgi:MFS family permease
MIASYVQAWHGYSRDLRRVLFTSAMMGFTLDGGIYSVAFNLYMLRLGLGPEVVGLVNSAGLLSFALASLPAGWLGGRFGARRMMVAGVAVTLAGMLAVPLTDMLPPAWQVGWLAASYVALYVGVSAYYVNCSPMLIGATGAGERTRIISLQSALIGLAAFAGGMLAGLLPPLVSATLGWPLASPAPYRVPLALAALVFVPALWAISRTHAARLAPPKDMPGDEKGAPAVAVSVLGLLLILSLIRFLQVAGVGSAVTFFNVYMDDGLGATTLSIGVISALARLLGVPAALLTPVLARRFGDAVTAVAGSFMAVAALLPLALAPTWQAAGVGFLAMMAATAVRYPSYFVYMMAITPSQKRAVMAGAGEMAGGFSFALIALVGGYIIAGPGYTTLFLTAAAMTLAGTLLLWAFVLWHGRKADKMTR